MKTGIEIIAEERQRQISGEGWTSEHDDKHMNGEMALAAKGYAEYAGYQSIIEGEFNNISKNFIPEMWPWDKKWWKPSKDKIRNLAKAGALIAAEIDRLERLQQKDI